jgi:hypothetical protein
MDSAASILGSGSSSLFLLVVYYFIGFIFIFEVFIRDLRGAFSPKNLSYLSWVFVSPDPIHLHSHDSPGLNSKGAQPPPPPLHVATAGKII